MSHTKVHGHNNYGKCLTMVSASTFIILFEPIKLYEGVEQVSSHFIGNEIQGQTCRGLVSGRAMS